MADDPNPNGSEEAFKLFSQMARAQSDAVTGLFGQMLPGMMGSGGEGSGVHWGPLLTRLQSLWADYQAHQASLAPGVAAHYTDPAKWVTTAQSVLSQLPVAEPEVQREMWEDVLVLFEQVLGQYGIGPRKDAASEGPPQLPRRDRRFADPAWREQPFFALLHQLYLMLSEHMVRLTDQVEGLEPAKKAQLMFAVKALADTLSPSNFPLTNPVAIERAKETRGQSLVKGMEHLIADLRRGQLTQTDPNAFKLGENIAATPGKVVHETPMYQLIQYTPVTEKVLKTPLVIFPAWINRFYILDLGPKKSFVKWAVEQGLTVFMVSWKSADASMTDATWDDYVEAQISAVDFACQRLKVPSAHTIGYCVSGTTLAATLAVLARKGEADKIKSATFFTAQVDFEKAGDLKVFVDDEQIELASALSTDGYLDGRYLAATFNLLRGNDLLWSYVVNNYLKGEDYRAFDLLHWNGDVTNVPAKWHKDYLRDLYRDNRMAVADSLNVCGVPLDLRKIETPCYIQAGREDHIAPPESVWKFTRYLSGPYTFLLAGSGHIAGVVNPPSDGKYQYWTNDGAAETLGDFIAGATEHPGSWWPHWIDWIRDLDSDTVDAKGKRKPGHGKNDVVIEDAPGTYVRTR